MGFLRLSFNLIGDPAHAIWPGRPVRRGRSTAEAAKDGTIRVALERQGAARPCAWPASQPGAWGAWRDVVEVPAGEREVVLPRGVGQRRDAARHRLRAATVVPSTVEVRGSVRRSASWRSRRARRSSASTCEGADDVVVPIPDDSRAGPVVVEREVDGRAASARACPSSTARDVGFVRGDEELRFPGFARLAPAARGRPPPDRPGRGAHRHAAARAADPPARAGRRGRGDARRPSDSAGPGRRARAGSSSARTATRAGS